MKHPHHEHPQRGRQRGGQPCPGGRGLSAESPTILTGKLEQEPVATLAMFKSMLTHERAGEDVRTLIGAHERRVRAAITADHADLRTSLISALCLGTVVGRYLLELDGLRDAELADITAVLAPCLDLLAGRGAEPAVTAGSRPTPRSAAP